MFHLSSHIRTFDVFNVKHLTPYFMDSDESDGSFQPRVIDVKGYESNDVKFSNCMVRALSYLETID